MFCLRKKNGCEKDSFRALIWDVVDGRRVQEFSRLDFGLLVNFKLRKDLKNNKIVIVYYDIVRGMTRRLSSFYVEISLYVFAYLPCLCTPMN